MSICVDTGGGSGGGTGGDENDYINGGNNTNNASSSIRTFSGYITILILVLNMFYCYHINVYHHAETQPRMYMCSITGRDAHDGQENSGFGQDCASLSAATTCRLAHAIHTRVGGQSLQG
jgi:hypothetical protein